MASGTLVEGGGDGQRVKNRWIENKVYTRKFYRKGLKKDSQSPSSQTVASEDGNDSSQQKQQKQLSTTWLNLASDDSTSLQHQQKQVVAVPVENCELHTQYGEPPTENCSVTEYGEPPTENCSVQTSEDHVNIKVASMSKQEIREIKQKLVDELEQVRDLLKQVEAKELQLNGYVEVAVDVVDIVGCREAGVGVDGCVEVAVDVDSYSPSHSSANNVVDYGGGRRMISENGGARRMVSEVILDNGGAKRTISEVSLDNSGGRRMISGNGGAKRTVSEVSLDNGGARRTISEVSLDNSGGRRMMSESGGAKRTISEVSLDNGGARRTISEVSLDNGGARRMMSDVNLDTGAARRIFSENSLDNGGERTMMSDDNIDTGAARRMVPEFNLDNGGGRRMITEFNLDSGGEFNLDNGGGRRIITEFNLDNGGARRMIPEFSLDNGGARRMIPEFNLENSGGRRMIPEFSLENSGGRRMIPEFSLENSGGRRMIPEVNSVGKREPPRSFNQLRVSVMENSHGGLSEYVDKEKRTPKANQYYRNSDFIVGKEKFPPPNKKSKTNGSRKHGRGGERDYGFGLIKHTSQVFKQSSSLLSKLMKHKHGWVFNAPVDVQGLGLHDYFLIIKHPMDLGTVKTRLNANWYRSPREFAEDVRLTFRNAMTYNPKGQDVHIMAEQLSHIFEDRWAVMETEYNLDSWFELYHEVERPTTMMNRAPLMPPREMGRNLDSVQLTPQPVKPKPVNRGSSGRSAALKKPKAKDQNKRDMTFEEKQKLSKHLISLPPEKLDNILEIMNRRNASLLQHDDAIEVDIDSVDAETLWELDRFVTNYKKSLSKYKRRAELAMQAREEAERNAQEKNQAPVMVEVSKETKIDEKNTGSQPPLQEVKQQDSSSGSSSSSSSSSDSDSSSSDSDSDSSSGSDAGHSPRT